MKAVATKINSVFFVFVWVTSVAYGEFIVSTFDPWSGIFTGTTSGQLAAFDAAVGITGYTIEGFEDLDLIPGLTVDVNNLGPSNTIGANTLGNSDQVFDGDFLFPPHFHAPPHPNGSQPNHIFNVDNGTTSFGIGIAAININTNVEMFVNELSFGVVNQFGAFNSNGLTEARQIYLRIDGTDGDLINSVRFNAVVENDGVLYDRVALATVPEPSTYALFLTVFLGLWWVHRKRRKAPSVA